MRLALNGRGGKVGRVLGPALEQAGHQLVELDGAEAMVDFTAPAAVEGNVAAALELGVPCVVGTTGFDHARVDALARERGLSCFHAPNFALGAVLMMRFAAEAAAYMPRAEIVELHNEAKKDAPSGTARATAEALGGDAAIHSVRLPGLVAHQEVLFGGEGQLLTIRHDTFSREAFVPGVLLALERLPTLPPGLTVGLDALL
ncbi:MAG: 4-hydroxy-tetrahydrodipicolinate reductase [Actinobacteria bacterium]|nr:MAG: 4-hydroxy-tetrahydrodipicolinate reductase [Actinomycetota bacterium]